MCWVFTAAFRLSLVAVSGGFSCCGTRALGSLTSEFAAHRLWSSGSVVVAYGLSGPTAWDLFGPRIEPMSPALVDRCLTTGPLGKSKHYFLISTMLPTLDVIYTLDLFFTLAPEYYSFHFSSKWEQSCLAGSEVWIHQAGEAGWHLFL